MTEAVSKLTIAVRLLGAVPDELKHRLPYAKSVLHRAVFHANGYPGFVVRLGLESPDLTPALCGYVIWYPSGTETGEERLSMVEDIFSLGSIPLSTIETRFGPLPLWVWQAFDTAQVVAEAERLMSLMKPLPALAGDGQDGLFGVIVSLANNWQEYLYQ